MARGIVWIPTTPRNATPVRGKKEFGATDPFILFRRGSQAVPRGIDQSLYFVDKSAAIRFDTNNANVTVPSTKERKAADPVNLLLV
jgi:hypothetical protein